MSARSSALDAGLPYENRTRTPQAVDSFNNTIQWALLLGEEHVTIYKDNLTYKITKRASSNAYSRSILIIFRNDKDYD